jgi:DNA-binding NarL/FixJ family response regulator
MLMRVLIVDDVAAVREALRLLLGEEPGFEVVGEAADGEEALRQVEALHPDLVLMDLEMPRHGGLLAIRELCLLPHPPRIVAMSVYGADDTARTRALAAGASVFVEKGATLAEVVAALRGALPAGPA